MGKLIDNSIDELNSFLSIPSLIMATKTEDEVGCVLRCHLIIENIMDSYLISQTKDELSEFFKIPEGRIQYATKIQLCLAFGMPPKIGRFLVKLNKIRNGFGHKINAKLEPEEVNYLAEICDTLKNQSEKS